MLGTVCAKHDILPRWQPIGARARPGMGSDINMARSLEVRPRASPQGFRHTLLLYLMAVADMLRQCRRIHKAPLSANEALPPSCRKPNERLKLT